MEFEKFLQLLSKDYDLNFSEIKQKWINFNTLDSNIEKWLQTMGINPELKYEMKMIAVKTGINGNDIKKIIDVVSTGKLEFKPGNLITELCKYFDIEKDKCEKFFVEISHSTFSKLNNSPNACCGKFELLYLLLVKGSKKSKRNGDIEVNKKTIEFKGKEVRLMNRNVSGKHYKLKMDKIIDEFNIKPNIQYRSKKYAFEPEKKRYREHYKDEFERINKPEIFIKIFEAMGFDISIGEVEFFFNDGKWSYTNFIKTIASHLVETTWVGFDELWIFNDGYDLKKFTSKTELISSIWSDKIILKSDYFRINQNFPLGWYIE